MKLIKEIVFKGKTFISVDIQPEYKNNIGFSIFDFTNFINKNFDKFNNIIFLYNGPQLGFPDEDEYKYWLVENGMREDILDTIMFYDKGYAFFRYCMDSGIDEDSIVNFVKYMYENDVNDSRELKNRDLWKNYIKKYGKNDVYELLENSDDMVNIPDLMEFIRPYNNIIITGGALQECLKEVEIALKALNKNYKIFEKFTY